MKKKKTVIHISSENQKLIRSLLQQIKDLQDRLQLICNVIIYQAGEDGNFTLSPDCTVLTKDEAQEGTET